jgi:2'-5' RNA ligase
MKLPGARKHHSTKRKFLQRSAPDALHITLRSVFALSRNASALWGQVSASGRDFINQLQNTTISADGKNEGLHD